MLCRCGCGESLPPSGSNREREFVDDAHRKRFRRRLARDAGAAVAGTPAVLPGELAPELVEAVERWAASSEVRAFLGDEQAALALAYAPQAAQGHVPSGLLLQRLFAGARFAARVEAGVCPGDDSCPWNLVRLIVADGDLDGFDFEACSHRLIADIGMVRSVETYRARKVQKALGVGDEAEAARWDRMVPAGCARGDHRWRHHSARLTTCEHCGANERAW